jgi:hydrogenase maturation protease
LKKTLLLGYGNQDRGDDGVAWHILSLTARKYGVEFTEELGEIVSYPPRALDFLFLLHLTPELAEMLAKYERICFIDAHTGSILEDLHREIIEPVFQHSPLTHHTTPETCLSIAKTLYGKRPEGILISVRGQQFEFTRQLSPQTQRLAEQAAERIWEWVENPQ